MNGPNLLLALVTVLCGAWLLRRYAWRALLFAQPSRMRLWADAPGDQMKLPAPAEPLAAELAALGFHPVGSHLEEPPLGPSTCAYDFASPDAPVFGTVELSRFGAPRLYFLSHTPDGGFVITANYRRPARQEAGRYVSGGLEGAKAERLLRVHLKRLEAFQAEPARSLEQRLELARAWWRGPGRSEVRQQNVLGLLWTLGTLGMVGAILFNLFVR